MSVTAVPTIFGAESMEPLLNGAKTVTRRRSGKWAWLVAGDRLWVREAFTLWTQTHYPEKDGESEHRAELVAYRATPREGLRRWLSPILPESDPQSQPHRVTHLHPSTPLEKMPRLLGPWKSPIYMPRWASRLTLEIESIQREPLQALADYPSSELDREGLPLGSSVADYAAVWDRLNPADASWDQNPSVWRVEFRAVLG